MTGKTKLRIVAVVQARLSSRRLPGKVLRPVAGRPMVSHLLSGLTRCASLDGVILATSAESSDDPIAEYAAAHDVILHRGPLLDVATRIWDAATGADAVVRVTADSPMLDPRLVDRAVQQFRAQPVDIVTNVLPRTFPRGQSVEVISRAALGSALTEMTSDEEREHVTRYIYAHPGRFNLRAFHADPPRPDVQLSVDDLDDFKRYEAILAILGRPAAEAGWKACVDAYDSLVGRPAP